jgi:hypothetical protein
MSKTTRKKSRVAVRRKASERRKNVAGNFRGSEDIFWTKIVKGFEKFCESPFN